MLYDDWAVNTAITIFFIGIIALGIAAIVSSYRRMSAIRKEFQGRKRKSP